MKRLLVFLMLAAISVASFSEVTRTAQIRPGGNIMTGITFTAADTCVTSDTLSITIANIQKYMQNVTATYTLDLISGSASLGVTLYGRVTSNGSWTSIGTATWDEEADNPQSISSTAPAQYNWYKLEFIASGATQKSKMLTLDVRTSNAFEVPTSAGTITLSRPTSGTITLTSKDDNANAALTISAGGSGALTLGDAGSTTAITSSDWAIDATGIATGLGAITTNGLVTGTAGATLTGAAINLNASSNYAVNIGTGTTTSTVTLGNDKNATTVLSNLNAVADGDSLILNPYKGSKLLDLRVGGQSKFHADTIGNITATGVIKGGYRQSAVIACSDGTETLDETMSGKTVVLSKTDGTSVVTIPDPSAATVGVMYYIVQTKDYGYTVTSTTANNNSFVCDHVGTSDSVAITTASHLIGSGMIVIGISATQWYVGALNPEAVLTPEAAD